eukprot:6197536-Prymnesium_polylepis.1
MASRSRVRSRLGGHTHPACPQPVLCTRYSAMAQLSRLSLSAAALRSARAAAPRLAALAPPSPHAARAADGLAARAADGLFGGHELIAQSTDRAAGGRRTRRISCSTSPQVC